MNQQTLSGFIAELRAWARAFDEISRVYLVGSQTRCLGSHVSLRQSDVDIIVFISSSQNDSAILSSLSILGLRFVALVHPLFIHAKDVKLKTSIPEYKQMLETGLPIYESSMSDTVVSKRKMP